MPSSLENRLKRVEEAIKPPGEIICVQRYGCEDDAALHDKVRRQLGREPKDADQIHIVVYLTMWTACPPGAHVHADGPPGYSARQPHGRARHEPATRGDAPEVIPRRRRSGRIQAPEW